MKKEGNSDEIKKQYRVEASEYNSLVEKFINKRKLANIQTVEYKTIALRLNIAIKLAKMYERFLYEETKNLLNINLNAAKVSEQEGKKNWLNEIKIPAIDAKGLEFYTKLDQKSKMKFNKYRLIFFVKNFVVPSQQHKQKNSKKEKNIQSQFYTSLENYQAIVAARMATQIIKEKINPLTPETGF